MLLLGFTEWHFKTANNNDHKKNVYFNTRLQVVLIFQCGLFKRVLNVLELNSKKSCANISLKTTNFFFKFLKFE